MSVSGYLWSVVLDAEWPTPHGVEPIGHRITYLDRGDALGDIEIITRGGGRAHLDDARIGDWEACES